MPTKEYDLKELTIEITRKCPLRCLLCSSDGGKPYQHELSMYEWLKVVDDADDLGTDTIILSGGEPTTSTLLIPICQYIAKKNIDISVYTSGNFAGKGLKPLDDHILMALRRISVSKIIVSIHGATAAIHDATTGVVGSFKNMVDTIKNCERMGLRIEFHFVPTRLNWKFLPDVVSLAVELGISCVSILRFVPQGRGEVNRSLLELGRDELIGLQKTLQELHYTSEVRIGAPFNAVNVNKEASCTSGISRATIQADGAVFPCEAMKGLSGYLDNNTRNRSLKEIWQDSMIFREARGFTDLIAKSTCGKCESFVKCRGGCPAQRLISGETIETHIDPICLATGVVVPYE